MPVLMALVLTLSGATVTVGSPAEAAAATLRVATQSPLVGEATVLRGNVAPARRPVRLQVSRGGSWSDVYGKRTSRRGAFAFSVGATATRTAYRVLAPRAKVAGRTLAARVTRVVRVQGRTGSGRINVVNAPIGQRADGVSDVFPGQATFSPARRGKPVHVYRLVEGQWRWIVSSTQNAAGTALFSIPRSAMTGRTSLRAVTVPGGRVAQVVTPTQVVDPKRRTFEDNFTGSRLDSAKWGNRAQPYHGNRLCARPSPDRVSVGGGVATLSVRKIANFRRDKGKRVCTAHGVWDNPMISTANTAQPFRQRNGVFAARIAFQDAPGMHGAFWLQGPGGTGAEIDVVEHFGVGHPDALTTKIHYTPTSGTLRSATTKNLMPKLRGRKATGWNVYSVEWSPTQYVFRINGVVSWVTKKPHVSTAEQEIILSLLTSDWNLPNLKKPASKMQVDWVRAWAW